MSAVPLPISDVAATDPDAVAAALPPIPISPCRRWCTARPAAASCTTSPRLAPWCARPGRRLDRRCGVGIRRAAARHLGAAGDRRGGLHLQQMPGRHAGHGLRGRAHRSARSLRRQCRKLVVRPGRTSTPIRSARLGQLPLHPAGAGAERAAASRSICSTPRAAKPADWRATPPTCGCCTTACAALGLTPCLRPRGQGPIIVNVHAPTDPAWDLQRFVDALKARGVLISNFYNTPSAELPGRLHRRHHARRHGARRRGDGRGVTRLGHRAAQGGLSLLATAPERRQASGPGD